MQAEKKVSIIVPVYNTEKYLEACVSGLCAQTYDNIEIILVDDGSTDTSGTLCDVFADKDSRIRVLHQKNSGVSAVRNKGMENASGELIAFVDADDIVEPDYVEKLLSVFRPGELAIAAYYIDVVNKKGVSKKLMSISDKPRVRLGADKISLLYASGLLTSVWNKLYEMSQIKRYDIHFDTELDLGEDVMFNLDYIRHMDGCTFNVTTAPVYHYMKRSSGGLTARYREGYMDIQKRLFKELKELIRSKAGVSEGPQLAKLGGLYFAALVTALDNLYINRRRLTKSEYKQKLMKLKRDGAYREAIGMTAGISRILCCIRYVMLRLGLYRVDFYMRLFIKRLVGLE